MHVYIGAYVAPFGKHVNLCSCKPQATVTCFLSTVIQLDQLFGLICLFECHSMVAGLCSFVSPHSEANENGKCAMCVMTKHFYI